MAAGNLQKESCFTFGGRKQNLGLLGILTVGYQELKLIAQ